MTNRFFFFFSEWEKLSGEDKRYYLITSSSQLCEDCGQVGDVEFRKFFGHSCIDHGYRHGEASIHLRECPSCSQFCNSVTDAIFHNANAHRRFNYVKCALIDCGMLFFNKECHNLHVKIIHKGWERYERKLSEQYGPYVLNSED